MSSGSVNNQKNVNTTTHFLSFVRDTKNGKYTDEKPNVIEVTYKRLSDDEHQAMNPSEGDSTDICLFGLTY